MIILSGSEWFILIVLSIPIYGLFIWSYLNPEDSYLFGKRWMYEEDPELTEEAIKYMKRTSMIIIIILSLMILRLFMY